jgi:hypothetical protein
VLADIARVKKGHRPLSKAPAEGASTVRRGERRTRVETVHAIAQARPETAETRTGPGLKIAVAAGILAFAAVCVVIAVLAKGGRKAPPTTIVPTPRPKVGKEPPALSPAEQNAKEMFDCAKAWAAANPAQCDEAIRRYQTVVRDARGTKYAPMAQDEIRAVTEVRRKAVENVLRGLAERTTGMVGEKQFAAAARVYETYAGDLALESASRRMELARELRSRQTEADAARERKEEELEQRVPRCLDAVAAKLVEGGISAARDALAPSLTDAELASRRADLETVGRLLNSASAVDERVLESFRGQIGKDVPVRLNSGVKTLTIVEVKGKTVATRQTISGVHVEVSFGLQDLSVAEKLARMGTDDIPEVALAKGLLALESGAYGYAQKYFGQTHPLLAARLVQAVDNRQNKVASDQAEAALRRILARAGVEAGPFDAAAWAQAVSAARWTPEMRATMRREVENFRSRYGSTDFAARAAPVLSAIEDGGGAGPAVPDTKKKASLPKDLAAVEGNRDAVKGLLLQRNPKATDDLVEILPHPNGAGTIARIRTGFVSDLTPLAALPDLKAFTYWVDGVEPGELRDLAALTDLSLESVVAHNCRVSDVSCLRSVPLKSLGIPRTMVRDISGLRGMKLESLDLGGTKVFDFAPLSSLPLRHAGLSDTQIRDLAVLRGLPLEALELAGTKVYDFSVLSGFRLKRLNLNGTQIRDLSALRGLPLAVLRLRGTGVTDLSPLRGAALRVLDVSETSVIDFTPLRRMPMEELYLSETRFRDTAVLAGMPLTRLALNGSEVESLNPLRGMPLEYLDIENTRVSDLTPLKETALRELRCRGIRTKDLSCLAGSSLTSLWIDNPADNMALVRTIPQLRYLNGVDLLFQRQNAPMRLPRRRR